MTQMSADKLGHEQRRLRVLAVAVLLALVAMLASLPHAALATGIDLANGTYSMDVTMEGGSGKASVSSPTTVVVEDGTAIATVTWSSPNYDYMLVDGERYLPVNDGGNSVFEIPVRAFDEPVEVVADTTAMSKPHEIAYEFTFALASAVPSDAPDGEGIDVAVLGPAALAAAAAAAALAMRHRRT